MSRGAFFDRRAFLISYDPTQDPEGLILERHLLINGPVGAGISLEYYFSMVDNEYYGCSTKIMHNIAGLLGVMEGAASDLRTGLPRQMIEIHEADAPAGRGGSRKSRCSPRSTSASRHCRNWSATAGSIVAAKDPDSDEIHRFDPAPAGCHGSARSSKLPTVACSLTGIAASATPCRRRCCNAGEVDPAHDESRTGPPG